MHHRFADLGFSDRHDPLDATVGSPNDPDDRMDDPTDGELTSLELLVHRVEEERRVKGGDVHHRAQAVIAVLGKRWVEHLYGDLVRETPVGELEHAEHLSEELVDGQPGDALRAEPARVRLGERPYRRHPLGRYPLRDPLGQLLQRLTPTRERRLIGGAHRHIVPAARSSHAARALGGSCR